MAKSSTTANYFHSTYATSNAAQSGTASRRTPNATYRGRLEIRTESRTPALIDSPIRFNFMMKREVEATTLKELYVTLTEKKGWRTICSAFYHGTGVASDKVDTETYKAFNRAVYEAVRRIKPMSFTKRRAEGRSAPTCWPRRGAGSDRKCGSPGSYRLRCPVGNRAAGHRQCTNPRCR